MRNLVAGISAAFLLGAAPSHDDRGTPAASAVERIAPNDNTVPGGTLARGVLTIRLEARAGEWHPDGDERPGVVVHAFAEEGKPLRVPGPLIRVTEGTEIHAFVRNSLRDSTLVVHGLSMRGDSTLADTIQVRPGEVREVRFAAGPAGTYYYWGSTNDGPLVRRAMMDDELSGAFVVDPRGTVGPARDRVFVIALWETRVSGGAPTRDDVLRFSINGRAWPNTERLAYTIDDTIRFRMINTSSAVHPMHLHGFYFNVNSRGNGTRDTTFSPRSPRRVVTERLAGGRTYTMTWVPERPGNWMFHCHDNIHVLRNRPFDGSRLPAEHEIHVKNHALEMMGGLVMGIEVRDRGVALAASEPAPKRRLRLLAAIDTSSPGTAEDPSYGYVLQEGRRTMPATGPLLPGPTILLKRGEPVSITVVNQLPEATAVHWHGIELDSYYDGVADFAGHPGRIAPAIAPRDSFVARFTPPRSGTFMYHPHADERRQQDAGLSGAIVVVDSIESFDPVHDLVILISAPRTPAEAQTVYLNGTNKPTPLELRAGERYRMRLINIHTYRPSMIVRVLQDTLPVSWRAIAKDGMDLPADQATSRPSIQQFGNGETYDFEITPSSGDIVLTVRAAGGALLVTLPIHVR